MGVRSFMLSIYQRVVSDRDDYLSLLQESITMPIVPTSIRKDILAYLNTSDSIHILQKDTITWLQSHHSTVAPKRPTTLYRGFYYSGKDLRKGESLVKTSYSRIKLDLSRLSSWSDDYQIARGFSLNSGEYDSDLQDKEYRSHLRSRTLSIVVRRSFYPKDILCSMTLLGKEYGIVGDYGDGGEYLGCMLPSR